MCDTWRCSSAGNTLWIIPPEKGLYTPQQFSSLACRSLASITWGCLLNMNKVRRAFPESASRDGTSRAALGQASGDSDAKLTETSTFPDTRDLRLRHQEKLLHWLEEPGRTLLAARHACCGGRSELPRSQVRTLAESARWAQPPSASDGWVHGWQRPSTHFPI